MLRNIGIIDQVIRAVLGLAFIALMAQDGVATPVVAFSGMIGAYLLATAIVLHCPLYRIFGFSTLGQIDRSA